MRGSTYPRRPALMLVGSLLAACGEQALPSTPEWQCGDGEVAALPLELEFLDSVRIERIGAWWLSEHRGELRAISRCGEEAVELGSPRAPLFLPRRIDLADEEAVLVCTASGLARLDFAVDATSTLLSDVSSCALDQLDGAGGVLLTTEFEMLPECDAPPQFLYPNYSERGGALWHVPDVAAPAAAVALHPCGRRPARMVDGWYSHTYDGAWRRLDLSGGTSTVIHDVARFVVASPAGDAWVWSPGTLDPDGNAEGFVREIGGAERPIGGIAPDTTIAWNRTGTHVMLDWFAEGVRTAVLVDAASGARADLAELEPGWAPCFTARCSPEGCRSGALLGDGFALCDDADSLRYFDPVAGTGTILLDMVRYRNIRDDHVRYMQGDELWEVDLTGAKQKIAAPVYEGYISLGDGRHISGKRLPGFPQEVPDGGGGSLEVDRVETFLYDPETGSETKLVDIYTHDGFQADLEFGALAYTRRDDAAGIWLRPLPP